MSNPYWFELMCQRDEAREERDALKAEVARLEQCEQLLALTRLRNETLESDNAVLREALQKIAVRDGRFDTLAEAVNEYGAIARAALAEGEKGEG